MNFILKYNFDELLRFLFGIICIILSLRLLVVPEAIENFTSFGVTSNLRYILGAGGLVGAALFIFEKTTIIGAVMLLLGFAYSIYLHQLNGQEITWLIVCVVMILFILLFVFKRKGMVVDESET